MTSLAKDTIDKIAVMQAFTDGAIIESAPKQGSKKVWTVAPNPVWNWLTVVYRVKPTKPDWVDWDAVALRFKYMARDRIGSIYLFEEEPHIDEDSSDPSIWSGVGVCRIDEFFQCYAPGDAPWKQSLVVRPKQKPEV